MILNSNPLLVTLVLTSFACFIQAQDNDTNTSTVAPGPDGDLSCLKCANGKAESKACRRAGKGVAETKTCLTMLQFLSEYNTDIVAFTLRNPIKLGKPRSSLVRPNSSFPPVTLCVSLGLHHSARHYGVYTMRNCITDEREQIEDFFKQHFKVHLDVHNGIIPMKCDKTDLRERLVVKNTMVCICNDKPNCNSFSHDTLGLGCLARAWSGAVLVGVVFLIRLLGQFINADYAGL